MDNEVKFIEFTFENCECFSIDAKYFGEFHITDFQTFIDRCAINYINKFTIANTIAFEIFSEADNTYYPFEDEEIATTKFNRLKEHMDIVGIRLTYNDNTTEDFDVNYNEGTEEEIGSPNINQHVYISSLGNLYLTIVKDKNIEDFFDKELINDKSSIDHFKSMILDES